MLQRGQGQVTGAGAFRIEAASLRVSAVRPGAAALVALNAPRRLQVSALRGAVRVTNSEGILLANIAPGKALELEAQAAGAAAPFKLAGTLLKRNGHFLLTDEVIGVTFELKGDNLDSAIGSRVELTGTLDSSAQPVAGAAQTLQVTALKVAAPGVAGGRCPNRHERRHQGHHRRGRRRRGNGRYCHWPHPRRRQQAPYPQVGAGLPRPFAPPFSRIPPWGFRAILG